VLDVNLYFAWIWILLGLISGTAIGMFFYDRDWLGGYQSWRRRMLRLGHIAFLGTGLLNVAFVLTARHMEWHARVDVAAALFLLGAASMPTVCFLSAWRDSLRRLFFVPVLSLIGAVAAMLFSTWR
jgi:hypothetical protein